METRNYEFKNPHSLQNRLGRALWMLVWCFLFRPSPWFMGAWRRVLLRCFGARLGTTWFHPSVRIWAPWLLTAGDHVFVDRDVNLYNAFGITLQDRIVISQGSFLCTATHDYTKLDFPLTGRAISVESDAWVAAQAFICPGVVIGKGAVVGARAVVARSVEPWSVVTGNPAAKVKDRKMT